MAINFGNVRKTDCVECVLGVTWHNPNRPRAQDHGPRITDRAPRPRGFSVGGVDSLRSNFFLLPITE